MRRAAKVDANHAEIVAALRAAGCSVLDLSRHGSGCPDVLVYAPRLHAYCLVEIKNGAKAKLTPKQIEFHNQWRGPVVVVKSVDEALKTFAPGVGYVHKRDEYVWRHDCPEVEGYSRYMRVGDNECELCGAKFR